MKFYRRLSPIQAISFDLDDTLYSNHEVMWAIEKKMINYFSQTLSAYVHDTRQTDEKCFDRHFWFPFRQQAVKKQANLRHDVVAVRLQTYLLGLQFLGMATEQAQVSAQAALDHFIQLRSDFTVPQSSIDLLSKLSEKYPLVAISNGNVDTKALGISQYFQHIYHAGFQTQDTTIADVNANISTNETPLLLKQKPASDMFRLACQQLNIQPVQLLHVGDCGRADIEGGLNAGCQVAWLSCYSVGKAISTLPHIELSHITALEQLLSVE